MTPAENSDARLEASSFRDPSGFLFRREGILYRQVNRSYRAHYDQLCESGLYDELVRAELLIPHETADGISSPRPDDAYLILRPEPLPFISYPYEWCFGQLQDAALATLEIQKRALAHGMSLKDASAYNIQFHRGKPLLIDTLSFERYREGEPWVAYRQFCQHFLAPLALMAYTDVRLGRLLRLYIDGIPLDLAGKLLPWRTRLKFSLLSHIHLHAKSQQRYADRPAAMGQRRMSRLAFQGLVDNLESAVRALAWRPQGTAWADYYSATNYDAAGLEHKKQVVADFLGRIPARTVWDLGANTGLFSRLASGRGLQTLAFDIDPAAVERNYRQCREEQDANLLPLLLDLTNPSPGLGWAHRERTSFLERGPAEAALALALVHHLAIANNLPLEHIAAFLARLCRWLIIEFVPKNDSQVQRLLASREDIFPDYTPEGFERAMRRFFAIREAVRIAGSERTCYLMERIEADR